ncbi:MAG: hypothetical protein CO186_10550 [Zetaproteobacteria bacterium CG_4_9_14_3_um_filter_49_83]|nr:MAG: hypothetical protein AUJ56_12035 [Zetaproteobacteria bacterium CG1_02_49_23]PIQ31872.1 MAG: hypothetical protein COW62_08615 [Zetaproteobacteria bacterium CG17_big_fil_post_rev_8_21_14_2_50_50_13]PIV29310.1 MAG: hypothetical protein COS35_12740 [Zetaproteobacteria bacterium CG02_land_8_20_14_3_00_50_9]PIY55405.1 MAG: hypothetical protein COZ00_09495 [Zetaproteobacteria bacterium CG_4_10_14_0_8_um_filter_49_80]PJA34580.1 MAG: hypothetical protein CO186_10550 [Zetaproteobacteria bacterium
MRLLVLALAGGLWLSSCGYHLVGQSDRQGPIPPDSAVVVIAAQNMQAAWLAAVQNQLNQSYRVIEAENVDEPVYRVQLQQAAEQMLPVAYDASGIAIQYQLRLRGSVLLFQAGKQIWQSGPVDVSGDVYASGGPADVISQQEKLARELYVEWARTAMARMRSGF